MRNKNPFIDESAFEGDEGPKKSEDEVLMEEARQHTEVKVVRTHMVAGMIIGFVVGALVGILFLGKMNTGAGIGMLIGLIAGLCIHKKPEGVTAEPEQAEPEQAEQKSAEQRPAEPEEKPSHKMQGEDKN